VGDLICTEGDCNIGEALIAEMMSTYSTIYGELGPDQLLTFANKFSPAVRAIKDAADTLESSAARQVPFSSVCCTIKTLGQQAQKQTAAMNAWNKSSSPDDVRLPGPVGGFLDAIQDFIPIALVVGLLYLASRE
jgi:hypothetical protein